MGCVHRFMGEELSTQGSLDSGRVQGLSSSSNSSSDSTSMSKLLRSFYNEGILFPEPLTSLPPEEEEVIINIRASNDLSNPSTGAPRRRIRYVIGEANC